MVQRPGNRILVIRGGAIGDFILTLPVFSALRAQFPTAELAVLGYPRIADLARHGGLVEEVRSIEERALAQFFARRSALDPAWVKWFHGFAIIISYLYDPDELFADNVRRDFGGQYHSGPHRPEARQTRHMTDVLLTPLQRLAIFDFDSTPRLNLKPSEFHRPFPNAMNPPDQDLIQWVQARRPVAIHPGSGSESKNWPAERWCELLSRWSSSAISDVLLVGGEAEGDRLDRLASAFPPQHCRQARSLPLPLLGFLLSSCRHFVGHDSGITHLAAAVGAPITALWGKTAEEVWKPRGDKVCILKSEKGLEHLEVDEVIEALNDKR